MSNLLMKPFFPFLVACVMGCASARAPEPGRSFAEALRLCSRHRLPLPQARPENLKPIIDCLEEISVQSPTTKNATFDSFRAELIKKYQNTDGAEWPLRQSIELETAIQVLLRDISLAQDSGDLKTRVERDLVLKHFPRTSELSNVRFWPIAKDTDLSERDPLLDAFKSGVLALTQTETESQGDQVDSKKQAELCIRISKLQADADYLGDLYGDQLEMRKLSNDGSAVRALKKYKKKLGSAVHELEVLRPELAMARQAGIFRSDACRRP